MKEAIFSDLDGTLLDHKTYSYVKAKKSINLIKRKKIPLVFCTSKTRAEVEFYRKKLGIKDPFISENGGAIFIPRNYFDFRYKCKKGKYNIIEVGVGYQELQKIVDKIKRKGIKIITFKDLTAKEVAKDAGLKLERARLAKKREYDVVFKVNKKDIKKIEKIVKKNKLKLLKGGRYYHINKSDKGKAVRILTKMLKKKIGKIKTIGFGDSENDFDMLDNVDVPYLVKRPNNKYKSKRYNKANGIGPVGFNKVILEVLK